MWIEVLLFFALLFLYVYRYVTGSFDEFKKQGIPYAEPSFPFGSKNAKKMLMGEVNFFDGDKILCENEFKNERIFGYFVMAQPTIVINDEELAKAILVAQQPARLAATLRYSFTRDFRCCRTCKSVRNKKQI